MKEATTKRIEFRIYSFMYELGLKNKMLIIYAALYSFSIGEYGLYFGTQKYLADTLNISLRTVQSALKELFMRGLIVRCESEDGKHKGLCCVKNMKAKPLAECVPNIKEKEIFGGASVLKSKEKEEKSFGKVQAEDIKEKEEKAFWKVQAQERKEKEEAFRKVQAEDIKEKEEKAFGIAQAQVRKEKEEAFWKVQAQTSEENKKASFAEAQAEDSKENRVGTIEKARNTKPQENDISQTCVRIQRICEGTGAEPLAAEREKAYCAAAFPSGEKGMSGFSGAENGMSGFSGVENGMGNFSGREKEMSNFSGGEKEMSNFSGREKGMSGFSGVENGMSEQERNTRLMMHKYERPGDCRRFMRFGKDGMVKMTEPQYKRLLGLLPTEELLPYMVKLETMLWENRMTGKKPPHSHYRTLKKWINEDLAL